MALGGTFQRRRVALAAAVVASVLVGVVGTGILRAPAAGAVLQTPLTNTGFETGTSAGWTTTSKQNHKMVSSVAKRSGTFSADLCNSNSCVDAFVQTITVPADVTSATLSYSYRFDTTETNNTQCFDSLSVGILDDQGDPIDDAGTDYCNGDQAGSIFHDVTQYVTAALQPRIGKQVSVFFGAATDRAKLSRMWVDDVVLTIDVLGPPQAVADVQAFPTGPGTAVVTWAAPPAGDTPTSYSVAPDGGSAFTVPATARTAALSGLSTTGAVVIRVAAINSKGTGPTASSQPIVASGSAAVRSARSDRQYALSGSDGVTWTPIDTTNLAATITVPSDGRLVIDGNADLWTETDGVNQDLGVLLTSTDGVYTSSLVQWKESGGKGGTFSPNAAATESVVSVASGITYSATLVWKTNAAAPGSTIHAGAGPVSKAFSPTRLGLRFVPNGGPTVVATRVLNDQRSLTASNGTTWTPIDTATLSSTLAPTADGIATVVANADLWTTTAGVNQDLGIKVVASDSSIADPIVGWKESGGGAGTFSPNAALVEARFPVKNGVTYTVEPVWKTNAPTTGTIYAGAGQAPAFSPLRVVTTLSPTTTVASAVTVAQPALTGSDGATWTDVDPAVTATFTPTADGYLLATANADLWTQTAGYNQDLGIAGATGVLSWKESGGKASAFSPNAATVQALVPVRSGVPITLKLVWKANKPAPGVTIRAGAGSGPYSPTRLDLAFVGAPAASA